MRAILLVLILALTVPTLFAQVPVINSFAPTSGPIGTQVTITGSNFSTISADNKVYFGTIPATVLNASATSLTVTVPLATPFQPISVNVNGLTAWSAAPFVVTYNDGGMDFTATSFNSSTNLSGGGFVTEGDLDGDGKTDFIYTRFSFDEIRILRNVSWGGNFSFTNAFPSATIGGIINPLSIKTGDLNGDGLPELVVTSLTFRMIYVLKNTSTPGNISFDNPITFGTGDGPRKLAIGDLDNDGRADIVVTNESNNSISVLRNTTTGGNISFATKIDFTTGPSPESVCIGDLDGDGKREIAVTSYSNASMIHVFKNSSTPGNISFEPRIDLATGPFPWDVNMGDLDSDGKPELLASTGTNNNIAVFRNTSAGSLSFATRIDLPTGFSPRGMSLADLNADGKPEIVTANWSFESTVAILKNNSTPSTFSFAPFATYNTNVGPGSLSLADFNADGLIDILTANSQSNSLSYIQNNLNITTGIPKCPVLLTPANNLTNVQHGTPLLFTWQKEHNATSYRLRIIEQSGAYTEVTTTDTFYLFPSPNAGINYTWNVRPVNMPDPSVTCAVFAFSTCPAVANPITIAAEGNTDKCAVDSVKLRASATGNLQWFLDGKPIVGATADTLWAKGGGNYTIRILNGACYSNPSNVLTITNLPTPVKPSLTVQGATTFCEGGSVQLTSSLNINNQWFKNNSPVASATGINYTVSATGEYFVRVTNTSSGCHNYSDTVSVQVNPVPTTPAITVTGSTAICTGSSATLQSSATSGNQWFKNGTLIAGAVNQQYTATEAGTYTVKVSNGNCTSAASTGVTITVNTTPTAPTLTAAGSTGICSGDSVKLQSSVATGNQWYKNGTAITGATGPDYFAKEAASFSVRTTQNGCTSASSNAYDVTVYPAPTKPGITSNGTAMTATGTGYTSYQWYLNNNIINGATQSQYATTQNGVYTVVVKDNRGCANTSDNFNYVTTAVNDVFFQGYTIQWFPNPVHDNLQLQVSPGTGLSGKVTVRVIDVAGRLVQQEQVLKNGANTIPMKQLPAGPYWIVLKNNKTEKTVRILKVN
jgi:hypothetical protein